MPNEFTSWHKPVNYAPGQFEQIFGRSEDEPHPELAEGGTFQSCNRCKRYFKSKLKSCWELQGNPDRCPHCGYDHQRAHSGQ